MMFKKHPSKALRVGLNFTLGGGGGGGGALKSIMDLLFDGFCRKLYHKTS